MEIRTLPEKLQRRAISELNEVPNRVRDDIDHIIDWIRQQPHLTARIDDQWIVAFLRGCKYSLERVKEKLDSYNTLRSVFPEIYGNRDPFLPEVRELFKRNMYTILPGDCESLAPRRTLVMFKDVDPNVISVSNVLKAMTMVSDILLCEDDVYVVNGQELIVDLDNISYGYLGQLGPRTLKIIVTMLQSAYPLNIKGIHYLNIPSFLQVVVNMFLSLLSEKIRSRVHFYSQKEFDNLYKSVPKSILPEEYDGEAGPVRELSKKTLSTLEEHYKWFEEDAKYGCDETKRPEKSNLSSESFGIDGSFRKLDID